jgi:hypothetical protein
MKKKEHALEEKTEMTSCYLADLSIVLKRKNSCSAIPWMEGTT